MGLAQNILLIGVDGGGTRCRFAAADAAGRLIAQAQGGAANIATDFGAALAVIQAGLADMMQVASGFAVVQVHLGMAGANAPIVADRLAAVLREQSALAAAANLRIVVEDDRRTAVTGALGGGDGAVISCGTGSFVCRQSGSDLRSVGGWGLALGDDASGAWLGQSALRRAVLAQDGLLAMTEMLRSISAQTGGNRPSMVQFSLSAKPQDYAALAPMIVEHAEDGDAEARRLMGLGAGYLSDCLQVLGHGRDDVLCLLGGVGRHYAGCLPELNIIPPRLSAVSGALILAARAAGVAVEGKPWT